LSALFRTVLAIACGYVVVLLIRLGGLLVVAALMFHGARVNVAPPPWVAANAVIGFVASIIGGALAARMAPNHPILHAAGLGVAILAIGVFAVFVPSPQSLTPAWYEPLVSVLGAIGAVVGGFMVREMPKEA
jgi:hypothetical protein